MEVFTLQKKQRKLFTLSGNFLRVSLHDYRVSLHNYRVSLHDYPLLPQSELVSTLRNDVVTKRRQRPQTSWRLIRIKNFMALLKACGKFLASCGEDFWLLWLRHFRFLRWLACSCGAATSYATFCTCIILDCTVYTAFLVRDMHFGKRTLKT